jgi:hypothetical protein
MKKTLATTALILVMVAGLAGVASTASAHPTKKTACSGCHGTSSAVKITLTKTSETTTTATYKIKVGGGSGTAGWAVLAAGKNLTHKTAASGSFTVNRGASYKIWAVKKGSGAKSKSLTVK